MSIEVEATDMLVDLGEGVKALNSHLSCLHHLAMHTLGPPWDVLNLGSLQADPDGMGTSAAFQQKTSPQKLCVDSTASCAANTTESSLSQALAKAYSTACRVDSPPDRSLTSSLALGLRLFPTRSANGLLWDTGVFQLAPP
ncbi:MAG: hypothetical protein FRX49_03473 [Trebouxia sp. A1-2]|nr:MAG: hypothetical protein FRX49_05137 [Trebouxia sp. A1-2]KAA6426362.1 MAG: hypothetical protein FRX49_03473 [Trebouxia sp. A1-2]